MATWWSIIDGTSLYAEQADVDNQVAWISNEHQAWALIGISFLQICNISWRRTMWPIGNVTHPFLARDLWTTLLTLYSPISITSQYSCQWMWRMFPLNWIIWPTPFIKCLVSKLQLPNNLYVMMMLNFLPHSYQPLSLHYHSNHNCCKLYHWYHHS